MNAAENFGKGWMHFLDCIDFDTSNLDAEAIQFMNEVPGQVIIALTSLQWMVIHMKLRADDIRNNNEEGSQGGYSPELLAAIGALDKLEGKTQDGALQETQAEETR